MCASAVIIFKSTMMGGYLMFKTPIFKGSCTAIVTPFNENGIDYDKMAELIDFQYDNGTSAIAMSMKSLLNLPAGTTTDA